MSYLLDTNVISEWQKTRPDAGLIAWLEEKPPASLFLSVLTLGEIQKGVELLRAGARKESLRHWSSAALPAYFAGRLLAVDQRVAIRWGTMLARAGRPIHAIDSLLAATAMEHGLAIVTRNVKDFTGLGVELLNPWKG